MKQRVTNIIITILIMFFSLIQNWNVYALNNTGQESGDGLIGCIFMLIICTAGCMIGLNTITKKKLKYKMKD